MTPEELKDLKPGDFITNLVSGNGYIVIYGDGNRIFAIKTVEVITASEWKKTDDGRIRPL